MTKKVFTIDTKPGIQRDGTVLDATCYNDGEWVRFQRGRPRKIGGYREMTNFINGYSRGIYIETSNGYNNIYNGYNNGMQRFVCDNNGIGAGITEYDLTAAPILTLGTLVGGSGYSNATYTQIPLTGGSGTGAVATIVVTAGVVTAVTLTNSGSGYIVGNVLAALNSSIGGGTGFTITVATVMTVTIATAGSSYGNANYTYSNISFIGGSGTGASGTITVAAGIVTAVAVYLAGNGYTIGDTLTVTNSSIGGGTGFSINVLTVPALNTLVGGAAYANATYTGIALTGGTGSGAVATVVVTAGAVSSVTLTSAGNGYTVGNVLAANNALIGGGTGFTIKVSAILTFNTLVGGSNYSSATYTGIPLTGGSGIGAIATIVVTTGAVSALTLTTAGSGYLVGDSLSAASSLIGGGSGFVSTVATVVTLGSLVAGSGYSNATYTLIPLTGGTGFGAKATIVVASGIVTSVTITTAGNSYLVGDTLAALNSSIGGGTGFSIKVVTIDSKFTASNKNLWQFDGFFDATGSGNSLVLAHPGQNLDQINNTTSTTVLAAQPSGSIAYPLRDSQGTSPTNNYITVSGGIVSLHPYVFAYGDNGLIKNCVAGNVFDWNGPDSNEVNVSNQKIVKGMAVRGGSNAPSGLFWALDSLIRVSYNPTTITTGVTSQQLYWRYDIVGSSTILSSQCVIEYDGIYYWSGVDKFMAYTGQLVDLPNTFNQNYFFDNLNYAQRQKVWATKVPRFGEIWWFYPKGDATECTDAIIYNVREKIWYDAGEAVGAQRTAGYFSQVFKFPVAAGADLSVAATVLTQNITTTNASAVIVTAISNQIALNVTVTATGVPVSAYIIAIAPGTAGNYNVTLSAACTASATVSGVFATQANKVSLWQHEIGTDRVQGQNQLAIRSSFETSDIGWVGGGPSQPQPVGDNYWLHLERLEPDFIQSGQMELYITGRPFAQSSDETTGPYYFDPDTNKIDLREQRRELRLIFVSDVQGGDYQMGSVLLSANLGDVRGY